jgi:hypothetical protein
MPATVTHALTRCSVLDLAQLSCHLQYRVPRDLVYLSELDWCHGVPNTFFIQGVRGHLDSCGFLILHRSHTLTLTFTLTLTLTYTHTH